MTSTFNPAAWLAGFEKVGGAYALTGERLFLWIIPADLSDEDLSAARRLVIKMTSAQRAETIAHLRTAALVEA